MKEYNIYFRYGLTMSNLVGIFLFISISLLILYHAILGFKVYVLSKISCLKGDYVKRYGKWAIVTGSTDGIGLEIARELARRGHSIILVARNEIKLQACKASIEQEPGAGEVITVKVDLSDSSVANYERALAKIDPIKRDVGILINNAGLSPEVISRLHNVDLEFIRNITTVNMLGVAMFTRLLLPSMLKRDRKSLVLNVSSLLGHTTVPLGSLYGPTKRFIIEFTEEMRWEYEGYPIDFICLTPGPINTRMFKAVSPYAECSVSADHFSRCAIEALSMGISPYSGHYFHGIMSIAMRFAKSIGLVWIVIAVIGSGTHNLNVTPKTKRRFKVEPGGHNQNDIATSC